MRLRLRLVPGREARKMADIGMYHSLDSGYFFGPLVAVGVDRPMVPAVSFVATRMGDHRSRHSVLVKNSRRLLRMLY